VINLAFSFLIPGVSWQGHVGGLLAGGAVASLYLNTRRDNQKTAQVSGLVLIVIVFVLLAVYRAWNFTF
jgi:membrane associated rhomboid family serine protease